MFSLKGQIKQIVHKAFWDNLEEELNKDPPNYEPAIRPSIRIKRGTIYSSFTLIFDILITKVAFFDYCNWVNILILCSQRPFPLTSETVWHYGSQGKLISPVR